MRGESFNDGWEFRPKVSPFVELMGATEPWEPVLLPHDAMLAAGREESGLWGVANGFFRTGAYEYRKNFAVPEAWRGCTVTLRFEGVYRDAAVFVNGELAAHRPYGYSEFPVELGELLRYGQDNVIGVEARTHDDARWYSGGGIYRNVRLFVGGAVHVTLDGVRITTPDVDADRAVVAVGTTVASHEHERRLVDILTELLDADGAVVATDRCPLTVGAGSTETVTQRLYIASPRRWGIDDPNLYSCRTAVVDGDETLDQARTTFGIRTLQVDPRLGLRINGESVSLRGACIHHDNGILGAATITRADERRVELLKAAGFNAIRSAHNPISRAVLDACDRLGLVVMDEAFDVWTKGKRDYDYATDFPTWWERDVEAMVAKDENHPSVVMYSIGNEIFEVGNASGAHLSRTMAQKTRQLDGTRYVTNGVNALLVVLDDLLPMMRSASSGANGSDDEVGINTAMSLFQDVIPPLMRSEMVTDKTKESFAALDIAGYNYLGARYEMDAELFSNRVIVGTESGIKDIVGNWAAVESHGHVIGDFCWTGMDYLGEVGIGRVVREGDPRGGDGLMAPWPWILSWCGDLDLTGHRKPASYFREIVFGLRDDPYLAVQPPGLGAVSYTSSWAWSDAEATWTWDGHEGRPLTVEIYAGADEVELLLNGEPVGRVTTGRASGFKAELEVLYAPGELAAVAYRDGGVVGRTSLLTAQGDLHLSVDADRKDITADHEDLAYLSIALADDAGTVHMGADRTVTVAVTGAGALQGLGSAQPATEESYLAASHTTFKGRALAAIRPTGIGPISVTVTAEGCAPATVNITAARAIGNCP